MITTVYLFLAGQWECASQGFLGSSLCARSCTSRRRNKANRSGLYATTPGSLTYDLGFKVHANVWVYIVFYGPLGHSCVDYGSVSDFQGESLVKHIEVCLSIRKSETERKVDAGNSVKSIEYISNPKIPQILSLSQKCEPESVNFYQHHQNGVTARLNDLF